MKKVFNYLLIVTLLLGTAVSFNSCKDDDEEDGKNGNGYSIVGTWKYSSEEGYMLMTLNSNGTGKIVESWSRYNIYETESIAYSYNGNVLTIYAGDEVEYWVLTWVDKNHFIDDDGDHWYRQ